MDHDALKQKLHELRDGELANSERAAVEQHLTGCSECRQSLDQWNTLSKTFFTPIAFAASDDFVEKVMARLEPSSPSFWRTMAPWILPAASLAGVVFMLAADPVMDLLPTTENLLLIDNSNAPTFQTMAFDDDIMSDDSVGLNLEVL